MRGSWPIKGGVRPEVFDTVAWDDIAKALEGMHKMYKIWYAKSGSGLCGLGY